ncbi:store-operated calcium entry-associated regulatory factor-like isoform X2 [Sinocyclocheilus anshuiensis]|uniref:store-operated calcium entry-associated regulatory factor-like isoform X2 n=1 Tax=Sinocyclocheilus anshuiensis TaxID=1608454 RepID=UPI0007B88E45|nr:PREDICTED: store-operated calcium entry-associated regulatory factor-like isoform X2 [Sinocyclocheilus anshuiensis]
MKSSGVLFLHFLLLIVPHISCWNDATEAVLLRDVQVLTLHRGRYTTARRSSPVLQLQCVGGSAGCGSFVPEVVQCYNRGSDGIDTQWECKADMDNVYRFGRVEVSCEGYNSPNDAYVLRGSCGLEYTLELTAEGKQQHTHGTSGFSDFASNFFQGFSNQKQQQRGGHYQQSNNQYPFQNGPSGDGVGGLIVVAFLLLVAYAVYKKFLCSPTHGHQGYHGDGSQGYPGTGDNSHGMEPPPPGFKPDYYSDQSSSKPRYGFSDAYTRPQSSWTGFTGGNTGGRGGGGFWTGMGTGGILGYLFGNQRRQPPMGFTGPSYTNRPSPAPKTSSGTRTASGFGGTKRR